MTNAPTRLWPLPDTHNIRDLGGYERQGGGVTAWRRLLRGDSLAYLSPESREALLAEGLVMVVDLRGPHETKPEPNPFEADARVLYRNIPLFDALDPVAMAAAPFDMAARYRDALDRCGARLAEVVAAIAGAPEGIVLFHCTAGKDRTGIVAAVLLLLAGVDEADIAADYGLTATRGPLLARLRERALARGGEPAHVERVLASEPATMAAMLSHLREAHGGLEAYLAAIGVGAAAARRVAARLAA